MAENNLLDRFHVEIPGAEQLIRRNSEWSYPQTQVLVRFPNGYGASVIHNDPPNDYLSHGVELAVLCYKPGATIIEFDIDRSTPVTGDVIGWLTPATLIATLRQIAELPPRSTP